MDPRALKPLEVPQAFWSTSQALRPRVRHVWDVNGFYAALGLASDADRAEIGRAYRDRRAWQDPWLTYAVTLLLHTEDRERYDSMVPGQVWADDPRIVARRLAEMMAMFEETAQDMGMSGADLADLLDFMVDHQEPLDSGVVEEQSTPHSSQWGALFVETNSVDSALVIEWMEYLARATVDGPLCTVALMISGIATCMHAEIVQHRCLLVIPDVLEPSQTTANQLAQFMKEAAHVTV